MGTTSLMSYDHDASDKMDKVLKSIVLFAVIGCITLSAAAYFLSQSMAVLTQPDRPAEHAAKH